MKRKLTLSVLLGGFALLSPLGVSPLWASTFNSTSTLKDTEASSTITAPQTQFTNVIDDLPLMTGLTTLPDEDVLFVAPHQGRIAETTATGAVDIDDVYRYYRRSLPHLGWKIIDGRTYARDGEQLRIDCHADGKVTTVRFSVEPQK